MFGISFTSVLRKSLVKVNLDMHLTGVVLMFGILNSISGYEDLSVNKSSHQNAPNNDAYKAVDRQDNTCMKTEVIGTTSTTKKTWWYVDLGDTRNLFGIRIQFSDYGPTYESRQRGRFAGFSLYVSNTTDKDTGVLCYKNGPALPPLDFFTECLLQGRYVIFYNERLDETTYPSGYQTSNVFTELCEVIVTGCPSPEVYGDNCHNPCSDNCQNRRCIVNNGTCLGCTPGWIGNVCDKMTSNNPSKSNTVAIGAGSAFVLIIIPIFIAIILSVRY